MAPQNRDRSERLIQVGQVLGKYELLERVGQGGMAIVYRGLDRSLKRTVAIKILHKHLADYQEARDRFEREAQAVAKLRHENIVEIFDYAAHDADCYIVTEFIDGQTLKQLITDRPIAFPEIGAMIILQACRALSHAHAAGILHRDVKPENIMVRSDGVVKLMDFGISHMVDLERLTVTGQLLGSPAYMAPEHVEGRPLDYRTDVFAAGIVLYQLAVGKLPFEGKNPHEVLKRIAECRFVDPRQANPRIGNKLGRIILRAMAAMPNDRYPAIGEMVIALEGYLDESGIASDKIAGELARYFHAPGAYEAALKARLVDQLSRRGQELLAADDRAGALDAFDRVLTIEPENAKVIAILDGINRRTRAKHVAIALAAAAAIGGGAWAINERAKVVAEAPNADVDTREAVTGPVRAVANEPAPPVAVVVPPEDAAAAVAVRSEGSDTHVAGFDAGTVAVALAKTIKVFVSPAAGTSVRFGDDGEWVRVSPEAGFIERAIDHPVTISAKNDCCEESGAPVTVGQERVDLDLKFLPGKVIARCDRKDVTVQIDGKRASLGEPVSIFFKSSTFDTKNVKIEFFSPEKGTDSHDKVVTASKTIEVSCDWH
jgi:tRNA A-37 threonylcarbamoyl transferase component Bud32